MPSQKRKPFFSLPYLFMSSLFHPSATTFCDVEVQIGPKTEHSDLRERELKKDKTSVGRGIDPRLLVVLRLHQDLVRTIWTPPHANAGGVPSAQPQGKPSFLQEDTGESSASAKPHTSRRPEMEESP